MINLEDIIARMKQTKASLTQIKAKLKSIEASGEAGAGLVKAIVNGHREVINISLDSSLLQSEKQNTLEDLIKAAVNFALRDVEKKIRAEVEQTVGFPSTLHDLVLHNK